MMEDVIAPDDLLGGEGVMRAGVDRAPVDEVTDLRLRLLAFDAAIDTTARILQPSCSTSWRRPSVGFGL